MNVVLRPARAARRTPCHAFAGAAAFVVAMACTSRAHADASCDVRWDAGGDAASEAWTRALGDVRELVVARDHPPSDCRSILVSSSAEGGATIVLVTTDGRTARRRIADPRDLQPTIEALLVSDVAGPPPAASVAPARAEEELVAEPARDAPSPAADRETTRSPVPVDGPALLVGAGGGIKNSLHGDAVAAIGEAFVGVRISRWELAAFGRLESEHAADEDDDAGTRSLRYAATGAGAMGGVRQPVGPLVLVAGARASLFAAEQERGSRRDTAPGARIRDRFLDPRIGLYAGCVFAELSRLRFRFQVDGDAGLVDHRAANADVGAVPRWNLAASIGAELAAFP